VDTIRGEHQPLSVLTGIALHLDAGGADHPARRRVDRDPVAAVVRKEIARGVKLVAVPTPLPLEDSKLGEPLSEEVKITRVAGARDEPWELGFKLELQLHGGSGWDLPGKLHPGDGEIIRVAVVGA